MSESVFRFRLSELTTVRLICQKCHTAIELGTDRLAFAPTT